MPYCITMIINGYTGWSSYCNKVVLDSSTVTVGENATKTDELDSGLKRSKMRGMYCPDKYSVVMEFDWYNKQSNGKTEYQNFLEWYKYEHKYGTVPFEFPSILYSPNTGIKIYDDVNNGNSYVEYYKITSAIEGEKSGTFVKIKMTWESVYTGIIQVEKPSLSSISHLSGKNGYIDVHFTNVSSVEPTSSDFTIYENDTQIAIKGYAYSGMVARLYYTAFDDYLEHTLTISNHTNCNEDKGDHYLIFQDEPSDIIIPEPEPETEEGPSVEVPTKPEVEPEKLPYPEKP